MSLKQLTIFVENKQGKLVQITDALAKNDVNIRALSIADTQDFGILRLIVTDYDKAEKTLTDAGFLVKCTEVVGVKIGDAPGKLSIAELPEGIWHNCIFHEPGTTFIEVKKGPYAPLTPEEQAPFEGVKH